MVQIHKSAVVLVIDFRWKNADVSRTYGLCHKIYLFLESSLVKVQLWEVSSL